jgi:hypothetical protein
MISAMFDFSNNQLKTAKANAKRFKNNNRIHSFIENGKRNLQDSNTTNTNNTTNLTPQEIYKKKVELILNLENTKKLIENLATKLAQHFNNKFSKLLNSTLNNTLSVLESQNITEFIVNNDNIHFNMMFTPIINIDIFDFVKYFQERVDKKQSYIDPKKCLKTYINSLAFTSKKRTENSLLNQVIFALYVFDKNPMFTISEELMKRATSNSHTLYLYDINGNHIELNNCDDEILHFIPLNPYDPIFIKNFNANPLKYELKNNATSINQLTNNSYMPIYIAQDGTIEKNLTIQQQIDKYYPVYKFYLSVYNVKNITLYNSTINLDKIYENLGEDSVKYIKNSHFVANSRKLDTMAVMNYYDPPKDINDRYYFLKNENVLRRSSNWEGNWCFITLAILFCINFIFIILLLIFGCLTPKFKKINNGEINKTEQLNYETQYDNGRIDDLIFDPNLNIKRNNMFGYLYKNEQEKKGQIKIAQNKEAAYQSEPQQIELKNVNIEFNENPNVNSEAGLKTDNLKQNKRIQEIKTSSLIHFIFKRNIYTNLFNLTSPFDPSWKFLTKIFTLIYLLLFFCTCMFIYSGIDFNPNDNISSGAIAQSIFISIGISNVIFTIINLFYSSMINNNRITNIINSDFNDNSM